MNIFDRHSIAPARNRTFAAGLLKLFLCQYVPCGLVEIDLAVGHFGKIHKAVLQAQQLQIARRAVERVAAVSGIHTDSHVIVAIFVGDVHG